MADHRIVVQVQRRTREVVGRGCRLQKLRHDELPGEYVGQSDVGQQQLASYQARCHRIHAIEYQMGATRQRCLQCRRTGGNDAYVGCFQRLIGVAVEQRQG